MANLAQASNRLEVALNISAVRKTGAKETAIASPTLPSAATMIATQAMSAPISQTAKDISEIE